MARLIRLDGSGHTTLAEWTVKDDAAFGPPRSRVPRAAGRRLHRHGARTGPARPPTCASSARGGPRDHAPADRRRVGQPVPPSLAAPSRPSPELASVPWRAAHRRRAGSRAGGASGTRGRCSTRSRSSSPAWDAAARAAGHAGRAGGARARLDHPRAYAFRGRERGAAQGPAQRGRRARGPGTARRPARPRRARAAARAPGWRSSAASSASGSWARRARCS